MTNKPVVESLMWHMTFYTSTTDSNLKINSSWRKDKSSYTRWSQSVMFFQTAVGLQLWHTTKAGVCVPPTCHVVVTLLNSQQMDKGQHRCQIISIRPPCSMCYVPIACLRSHRPTNPCWLHAHLPIHCTGNQLPRQPQSPCACLSVKTNSILHFTCTTVSFSFIHPFMHLFPHLPVSFWEHTWCWSFNFRHGFQSVLQMTRTNTAATVFYPHQVGQEQWKNW